MRAWWGRKRELGDVVVNTARPRGGGHRKIPWLWAQESPVLVDTKTPRWWTQKNLVMVVQLSHVFLLMATTSDFSS